MFSLSDLVQALKMADELSIWAGLPLYGIGYGIAIWAIALGLAKLWNVIVSWGADIKAWRSEGNANGLSEIPWYLRVARWAVVVFGIAYGSLLIIEKAKLVL